MLTLSISLGITFTAVLLIFQLTHCGYDIEKQKREKNKQEKSIPLIPDYFSPSCKRGSQSKMHLLSKTKSCLGAKQQKLRIFPLQINLHISELNAFPLRVGYYIWFLCNFVQKLLAPTTIRTKLQEYCHDLKSGVCHPSISSLSILQNSYSLSIQTSVAC